MVHRACTVCHRAGEAAPFALVTFADAQKRRDLIVEMTQQRRMPPWLPTHGEFVGDRRLRGEEIELLRRWVEAGAPRGDVGKEPAPPVFATGWQLGQPDLVLTATDELVVEGGGGDVFRNLVMPVEFDGVKFVAAVEIRPGNRAVHHAVLAVDATRESRRLDALDAQPGFAGMVMGNAQPPDGTFLGWTPGKQVLPAKQGMAFRLFGGHDFVLQLHVQPTGKREVIRPQIGLYFTEHAPQVQAFPLVLWSDRIDIPAGEPDFALRDEFVLPVAATLHAIYPHAHYLGKRLRGVAILPNQDERVLLEIARWDFDWQDDYRFAAPVPLPAGSRLVMDYRYDNSAANESNPKKPPVRVRFGQRSVDEMGTLTFSLTVADEEARQELQRALLRHDLQKAPDAGNLWLQLAGLERERGDFDAAFAAIAKADSLLPEQGDVQAEWGLCHERAGRIDEARRRYRLALQRDPTQGLAHAQLGTLLARGGETAKAKEHFQRALAAMPNSASLHHNFATASFSEGDLLTAADHYRRAVQIDPGYVSAWLLLARVLLERGDHDGARAACARAATLAPDNPAVAQLRRQLER